MKTMRKVLSVLLVLAMILSLGAMAVSAAEVKDGVITVTDAQKGETYSLYKLFDLSYDQENTPTKFAYTYTKNGEADAFLTALQAQESPFALEEIKTTVDAGKYNVTLKDGKKDVDVVKFLKDNAASLPKPQTKEAGTDGNLVFDQLDHGYYYLTSTSGTLVTLDSNTPTVDVQDKNEAPTLTKQVLEDSNHQWGSSNTASIGENVEFKITIAAKHGAENYVVHDTLPAGMTYNGNLAVANLTKDEHYSVTVQGQQITVTFTQDYLNTLNANTLLEIRYTAQLNHSAVVGAAGNVNTAYMTYGAQGKTADATTTTDTYGFDLVKTTLVGDPGQEVHKLLNGAAFKLYNAKKGGNEIKLIQQADGSYHPLVGQETAADRIDMTQTAKVRINGLDNGTYYLEEVQAPAGYNKVKERIEVKIKDANLDATVNDTDYTSGGIEVVNRTGAELPSTGGMGTTMFYVLGAVLVLGAAIALVAKRRVREQ